MRVNDSYEQSCISRTPYPAIGGFRAVTGGPKFSPVIT